MTGAESVAVLQAGRGAHRPPLSPQIGWEREENGVLFNAPVFVC